MERILIGEIINKRMNDIAAVGPDRRLEFDPDKHALNIKGRVQRSYASAESGPQAHAFTTTATSGFGPQASSHQPNETALRQALR